MMHLAGLGLRLLGITLFCAGSYKVFNYPEFVIALGYYAIVPPGTENTVAAAIIVTELWLGTCLAGKLWLRHALPSAVVMLGVFTSALVIDYVYSDRRCGYWFAVTLGRGDFLHIAQNTAMTAVAFLLWRAGVPEYDKQ